MPLRADFTSGPSQQQDSEASAASGEQVDNSLVELHDAHQRGVTLLEEDEPNAVPSLDQQRPEQVNYEQTAREISGKYPMHPSVSDVPMTTPNHSHVRRDVPRGRFVANVRAERGNGVEAVSRGFRGATYGEALRNLWQGVSDTYRVWADFPVEEGEAAREAFI